MGPGDEPHARNASQQHSWPCNGETSEKRTTARVDFARARTRCIHQLAVLAPGVSGERTAPTGHIPDHLARRYPNHDAP